MVAGCWLRGFRLRQIKCVLGVARGMVCRRIERVEAMIFVLDLRSIGYDEANLAETPHDVVGYLRERMQLAERAAAAGQSEVGGILRQGGLEFEFVAARCQSGFE